MRIPEQYSLERLLDMAATKGRVSVRTQYACEVIAVSEDGRFVDLVHNTLEWQACSNGDKVLKNSYGYDVLCSPTEPWIVTDIPVEQPYERGQWKVRTRPKVGDRGILSVFYHDTNTLKEKGGFQAPESIRVMAIDSASWRPGLPNHADVNAETSPYPTDDEWELDGNGVKIKLTSPANGDSQSPNKMDITVGTVNLVITAPQSGTPTVELNAPNGTITMTTAQTTINSDVTINGTVTTSSTIISGGDITSGGDVISSTGKTLDTHKHGVPAASAITPPPAPTPSTSEPI